MRTAAISLLAAAVLAAPSSAATPTAWWSATYEVQPGATIELRVSDSIPRSEATQEWLARWATFIGGLPHGDELAGLVVSFVPRTELSGHCGSALACYFPEHASIIVPAEPAGGWPVEHLLAHEYGHHVASHRENPPWGALFAGTRRWATYMRVCELLMEGTATLRTGLPSDAGEAFAETYRELAYRRGSGWPAGLPWDFSYRFLPNERALAAVEEDVLRPWRPSVIRSFSGRVSRPGAKIRLAFDAVLDGTTAARLVRGPRGATLRFVGAKTVKGSAGVGGIAEHDVCADGSVQLELTARRRGAYTVAVVG